MEKDRELKEIIRKAKKCAESRCLDRKEALNEILGECEKLLDRVFQTENRRLSEEEFIKKQTYLQYITYSLAVVTEKHELTQEKVNDLFRSLLTSLCAVKDAELAGSFDRVLSVVIVAAGNLNQEDYDRTLESLLEVVKYSGFDLTNTISCPSLFNSRTLARVANESFFKPHLTQNIIGAVFGPYSENIPSSNVFPHFWPECKRILRDPKQNNDSWIVNNCLRTGLKILKQKRTRDSTFEQAHFVNDLFSVFTEVRVDRQRVHAVLNEVFKVIRSFIADHGKVLMLKKELREKTFDWLIVYMQLIDDYVDHYGALDTFSEWFVLLNSYLEVPETPANLCTAPAEICVKRIKLGISSATSDCLNNYLDILMALFKISRVQNDFLWVTSEVQKQNSLDNHRWPRLLKSLLSVQHPSCQQFCKKFAPSIESLWAKIRSGESSRIIVNSLAVVIGSCHFLGTDEGGKQIIPILLLACFHDFKNHVGARWNSWNNFRLAGGGKIVPAELADLEKYTQVIEYQNSEITKLKAVNCALQIEKKTGKYVSLVADMAAAVFSKAQTDKITNCLPALEMFLSENPTFITEFVNILIGKLYEKHDFYSEEKLIALCRTTRKLVCLSANRKGLCSKCEKNINVFVEPDKGEAMKMNEEPLKEFVKMMFENTQKHSDELVGELLEMCRVILLHIDSPRLATDLISIIKALEIAFSEHSTVYFRVWELISWRSDLSDEKKLHVYIPVLNKLFSQTNINPVALNEFMRNVLHAKISDTVKIIVYASLFACSAVSGDEESSIISSNWTNHFARQFITSQRNPSDEEILQAMIKRYTAIFTQCFVSRLLFNSASAATPKNQFDESKTRELVRTFVSKVTLQFKLQNLMSTLLILRPSLLYWSLVSGAKGESPKIVCFVIDFLCQELVVASTSSHVPADPSNTENVMKQRNGLITEMFQDIVQYSAFESFKDNETIWKFCSEYCHFTNHDMKCVTSAYRKAIFESLLLVSPEDFDHPQNSTPIVMELQKTYEQVRKGEKFSVETATRDKGTDLFFAFRTCFTNDLHFWMRERAAVSFQYVLHHIRSDFFEANWYVILSTLRNSPPTADSTRRSWLKFADRISYATLRNNLWRIMTDVARVAHNEAIIERIWQRLSYSKDIEALTTDPNIVKFFWVLPLEIEKKENFHLCIAKSRRIDDVFEFITHFRRYPSLLFVDHLSSKLERGAVWKDEYPKLIGALTGILPYCQSAVQRNQVCTILQKNPILNSEYADNHFIRWDSRYYFFSQPDHLTKAVLDECAWVVETMASAGKTDYADRTMCEVFKSFAEFEKETRKKAWLDGLTDMYAKMTKKKPHPPTIEQKAIEEMARTGKSDSFPHWLTILIVKCARMTEDTTLASLIPIAHIKDTSFLTKMAMRFILSAIVSENDVTHWILSAFEDALLSATTRKTTESERGPACFVLFVFDFLYYYMNSEEIRKNRTNWERVFQFWMTMFKSMMRDEYGHEQPLIVKVAELFGMEKRCILWLEMGMEQKTRNGSEESEKEAAYYFTLMNLYARIHELNGVRGAYAMLRKVQIDHVYGKICLREAFGDVAAASTLAAMSGKGKAFDPAEAIRKFIEEQDALEYEISEREEHDEQIESLKLLTKWIDVEKDIGPSPHVFARTIESRSVECKILTMIREGKEDEEVDRAIEMSKQKVLERLAENALGGSCSYETATPFIVQVQQLDEIVRLKNTSVENLVGFDNDFWKSLQKRTEESEQRMDVVEPILRARRCLLETRMKSMGDRDKDQIRSRIVEAHLQSARIARLTGCPERAQLAIINAKKVLPFDNKIVLEEAKLQLQTSDELSGMNLLDSIIEKTFGELSRHYGDTQQCTNIDLQATAKHKIENFPTETKNLFSSVQMLRISHMIKAGNSIGFEKIYNETTNLLQAFVSSGVMYEAAWLLDYLFHYNERNRPVLPLLKAYQEVAKYEKNNVLRARAVERMMSLWLSNTRKISGLVSASKYSNAAASEMLQSIKTMNREITLALDKIGTNSFYPAYAVLARHIDHQDEDVFRTIKHIMHQLILRLPHQCMWQSVYLLRQDIAEIKKRYMEVLTSVKRKDRSYVTLIDQYDYASAVFNQVPEKVDSDNCKLSEKVGGLKTLFRDKKYDSKELIMDRRGEGECKALFGIMVPIRSVIDGSVYSEDEPPQGYLGMCTVPDRYLIHDFSDKVKVLHSKTKPVLIELTTMEGRKVRLICKKEDDLTKDYFFTKMVEMCNDLLIKDEQTRIQNMAATTYSVIPLAKYGGIIEFMDGVTPFFETLSKLMGKTTAEWSEMLQRWAAKLKVLKKEEKAAYFRRECCAQTPLVMAKWFRSQFPEAGKWFASRKLFAKSSAVMSMIGYIFGLGDRHTKNLMVHLQTGKCVHVDFDMIFNKGELLGTPEVVPFRLTRNMINGMGEVALEGEFKTVCEQTLRVFRENSYEIEKYIADLPNLVSDFNLKDFDMTVAKRLISGRLRGQIVTAKLYRSNAISHPMQVSQLASSLIELATSDEKLCEMFEGWMPTL